MQPLTEKQTQRVWSRVMSAQTAPAAAMENPAPAAQAQSETLTPEKLLSLIDGERADSALYAHLATRMKGRAQAMLRKIPRHEFQHRRRAHGCEGPLLLPDTSAAIREKKRKKMRFSCC